MLDDILKQKNGDLKQIQNLESRHRKQALKNLQKLGVIEINGDQKVNVIEQKLHLVPTSECTCVRNSSNSPIYTLAPNQLNPSSSPGIFSYIFSFSPSQPMSLDQKNNQDNNPDNDPDNGNGGKTTLYVHIFFYCSVCVHQSSREGRRR